MPTFLARLVRASNLLSHHLDDRITELGIGTQEYLLLRRGSSTRTHRPR